MHIHKEYSNRYRGISTLEVVTDSFLHHPRDFYWLHLLTAYLRSLWWDASYSVETPWNWQASSNISLHCKLLITLLLSYLLPNTDPSSLYWMLQRNTPLPSTHFTLITDVPCSLPRYNRWILESSIHVSLVSLPCHDILLFPLLIILPFNIRGKRTFLSYDPLASW